MLYCSLWRPGCSASAGNMICYNEWNKLKQECLPSLFKLNLYLAQSVSGGLIQRVTNIITTLNLNIRLFYFWKICLGCRWWGVRCTVSGAGCGLAWSDLNVAARARWSHHHAASRHPDIILWQRWPPPASVFYPHIIARVAALPSSWLTYSFRDRNPSQEPRHHDESQFQAWCALCSGHIRHTGVIRVPLLSGT